MKFKEGLCAEVKTGEITSYWMVTPVKGEAKGDEKKDDEKKDDEKKDDEKKGGDEKTDDEKKDGEDGEDSGAQYMTVAAASAIAMLATQF